ncbi:hypothetical protein AAMO2058_000978400 [Amorphochlora amoebiformis]
MGRGSPLCPLSGTLALVSLAIFVASGSYRIHKRSLNRFIRSVNVHRMVNGGKVEYKRKAWTLNAGRFAVNARQNRLLGLERNEPYTSEERSFMWGPPYDLNKTVAKLMPTQPNERNKTHDGFQFMTTQEIEDMGVYEAHVGKRNIDPSKGRRVNRPITLEDRLNFSYFSSFASAVNMLDPTLVQTLPEPRWRFDEKDVDYWGHFESVEIQHRVSKLEGEYARRYVDALPRILQPFTTDDYSHEVRSGVAKIISDVLTLSNNVKFLEGKRGEIWNRYVHMLPVHRRTYRDVPIFFLEKYVAQRLLSVLDAHGDPKVDGYAGIKQSMLQGANATFLEFLASLDTLKDPKLKLPAILQRSTTAGRVDYLHFYLWGEKLKLVGVPPVERLPQLVRKRMVEAREVRKKEWEQKRDEEIARRIEREKKRSDELRRSGKSIFDVDLDEEQEFDIDNPPEDWEREFEVWGEKSKIYKEKQLEEPPETSISYEGRSEGVKYIGDEFPDEDFGVRDYWGHKNFNWFNGSVFIRDDTVKASEKMNDSQHLLLLAGNAGLECLVDLLGIYHYLTERPQRQVTVHLAAPNRHPSMATRADINDAIEFLSTLNNEHALNISQTLKSAIQDKTLVLQTPFLYDTPVPFWSAARSFGEIISNADYIIVKSDYHYRRLTGDLHFPPDVPFSRVTRNIFGRNKTLLALRPISNPGTIIGMPVPGMSVARNRYEGLWDCLGILCAAQLRYDIPNPENMGFNDPR